VPTTAQLIVVLSFFGVFGHFRFTLKFEMTQQCPPVLSFHLLQMGFISPPNLVRFPDGLFCNFVVAIVITLEILVALKQSLIFILIA
jgi:hypothetical protein